MFDNLRDFSDEPLYEDETNDLYKEPENVASSAASAPARSRKRKSKNFLGMTAMQRFILSVMVMLTVCMVGTLAMFVLGKMSI
ncbi:MAG: hypothetical protein IPP66_00585 [Anaerolineales bacterium]|nr:hypothetical protein [Anaerolineales bacterium]